MRVSLLTVLDNYVNHYIRALGNASTQNCDRYTLEFWEVTKSRYLSFSWSEENSVKNNARLNASNIEMVIDGSINGRFCFIWF